MFPIATKVIIAIACGVGIGAGALTYIVSHSPAQALLAAGTATGSSVGLLRQFVCTEPERSCGDLDNDKNDYQGDDDEQKHA